MIGLGTMINSVAILAGGLIGLFTGKYFHQEQQDALSKACGISVLFIAIAGAMQGMLNIDGGKILSGKSMSLIPWQLPPALAFSWMRWLTAGMRA
jgi:hypothetical protein